MAALDMSIDATALDALARAWLAAPDKARAALVGAVTEGGLLLEREWKDRAPKGATGAYEASISARPVEISGEQVIGEVGSSQAHVLFVELGTKPHMPPVAPLVDWAKSKFGLSDKEAKRVGYAVALKIKAHGTEGQHIAADTFEDNLGQLGSIFERWIADLARQMTEVPRG